MNNLEESMSELGVGNVDEKMITQLLDMMKTQSISSLSMPELLQQLSKLRVEPKDNDATQRTPVKIAAEIVGNNYSASDHQLNSSPEFTFKSPDNVIAPKINKTGTMTDKNQRQNGPFSTGNNQQSASYEGPFSFNDNPANSQPNTLDKVQSSFIFGGSQPSDSTSGFKIAHATNPSILFNAGLETIQSNGTKKLMKKGKTAKVASSGAPSAATSSSSADASTMDNNTKDKDNEGGWFWGKTADGMKYMPPLQQVPSSAAAAASNTTATSKAPLPLQASLFSTGGATVSQQEVNTEFKFNVGSSVKSRPLSGVPVRSSVERTELSKTINLDVGSESTAFPKISRPHTASVAINSNNSNMQQSQEASVPFPSYKEFVFGQTSASEVASPKDLFSSQKLNFNFKTPVVEKGKSNSKYRMAASDLLSDNEEGVDDDDEMLPDYTTPVGTSVKSSLSKGNIQAGGLSFKVHNVQKSDILHSLESPKDAYKLGNSLYQTSAGDIESDSDSSRMSLVDDEDNEKGTADSLESLLSQFKTTTTGADNTFQFNIGTSSKQSSGPSSTVKAKKSSQHAQNVTSGGKDISTSSAGNSFQFSGLHTSNDKTPPNSTKLERSETNNSKTPSDAPPGWWFNHANINLSNANNSDQDDDDDGSDDAKYDFSSNKFKSPPSATDNTYKQQHESTSIPKAGYPSFPFAPPSLYKTAPVRPLSGSNLFNKAKSNTASSSSGAGSNSSDSSLNQLGEMYGTQGKELYSTGQYDKALECFNKCLGVAPKSWVLRPTHLGNRAAALVMLNRFKEAVNDCDDALKMDSTLIKLHIRKARCLLKMGHFNVADEAFSRVLEYHVRDLMVDLNPDEVNESQLQTVLETQKVEAKLGLKEVDKLRDSVRYLIVLEGQQNYAEALKVAESILSGSPYYRMAQVAKASALNQLLRFDEAKLYMEDITSRTHPTLQSFYSHASITGQCPLLSTLIWVESKQSPTMLVDIRSVATAILCMGTEMGLVYLDSLKNSDSVRSYCADVMKKTQEILTELLLRLSDEDTIATWAWVPRESKKVKDTISLKITADMQFKSHDFRASLYSYSCALKLDPSAKKWCAILYSNRAACYLALDQFSEAVQDCHSSLLKDPGYSRAYLRRARAHKSLRKYNDSVRDYRRYLCSDPAPADTKEVQEELNEYIEFTRQESKPPPQFTPHHSSGKQQYRAQPQSSSKGGGADAYRKFTQQWFEDDEEDLYAKYNGTTGSAFKGARPTKGTPFKKSESAKQSQQSNQTNNNDNNNYSRFQSGSSKNNRTNNNSSYSNTYSGRSRSYYKQNSSSSDEERDVPSKSQSSKSVDHYTTLGTVMSATDREITTAYRKLALKFHPDKNKEEGAEDTFKSISFAYSVLSDKTSRRQYDLTLPVSGGRRY